MAHINSIKAGIKILSLVGLGFASVSLGGCRDDYLGVRDELRDDVYLARRDSITLSAGNAVATNRAIQTIDPWPWYVRDKRIHTNGERMYIAVDCYEKNQSKEPAGLATSEVVVETNGGNGGGAISQECGVRNGGDRVVNGNNGNSSVR